MARPANPGAEWSPSLETRTDDAAARLWVSIAGQVTGRQVSKTLSALYLEHPRVTGYDMVFDVREYRGSVWAQDLLPIVAAYRRSAPPPDWPCRTAFITTDPNARYWAAVMSFQFVGREHRAFTDLAEAEAWLDPPIEGRPPFRGPMGWSKPRA